MSKFQIGDIVVCQIDYPRGARIKKGELAIITFAGVFGYIWFNNYPKSFFIWDGLGWSGDEDHFELYEDSIVENE